jgi:hypothetical protein
VAQIVKKTGHPVDSWRGNCHAVACDLVEEGLVKGTAVYGHFFGYISPDSPEFGGRPMAHHGWVRTPDGKIVDPTRWVFENVEPYVWVGDANDEDYDEGSNRLRAALLKPAPEFDDSQRVHLVPGHFSHIVTALFGTPHTVLSLNQIHWLANVSPDTLGNHTADIYEWIRDEVELPGFIPIDNRRRYLGS